MSAPPSIAVVLGSTREGRFGPHVAEWLVDRMRGRSDLAACILDPRDFSIPIFSDSQPPAVMPSSHGEVLRWAKAIDAVDGVVFVTPEYNHGIPGVLKNLLDYGGKEWHRKPAAFVGYGSLGASRAIQALRHNVNALQMAPLYRATHLSGSDFQAARGGGNLAEFVQLAQAADAMLQDLVWWAAALRAARTLSAA